MSEERWMKNPFGLRIAILGKEKPLKGAPVGGNSHCVTNPRNTFKKRDLTPHTRDYLKRTKSEEILSTYRG